MSILIAKKYVKALVGQKDISQINDQLKLISSAYSDTKFNHIISLPPRQARILKFL